MAQNPDKDKYSSKQLPNNVIGVTVEDFRSALRTLRREIIQQIFTEHSVYADSINEEQSRDFLKTCFETESHCTA
jgi:hypothetical protein